MLLPLLLLLLLLVCPAASRPKYSGVVTWLVHLLGYS
jgi:hypothetical protein